MRGRTAFAREATTSPTLTTLPRGSDAGTLAVFVAAIFLGASVLFVVAPMVAKMLLPLAVGKAAVWTTSVLFFQLLLTYGYAYAHGLSQRLAPVTQLVVHLCYASVSADQAATCKFPSDWLLLAPAGESLDSWPPPEAGCIRCPCPARWSGLRTTPTC